MLANVGFAGQESSRHRRSGAASRLKRRPVRFWGLGRCPPSRQRVQEPTRALRAGRPGTPVGSSPVGNNGNAEAFALHAKRSASFDLGNSDGIQRGNRSGSAYTSDATGSNGPASAREECDGLRADAIDAATRHHRAARHPDHRPASGAARRQAGEIRRRALPTHRN
jgi:hypothetical protein